MPRKLGTATATALALGAAALTTPSAHAAPQEKVERAWQDTHVRSAYPTTAYGQAPEARVTASANRYLLEFNSSLPAGATATGLRLCVTPTRSTPTRPEVYAVPGDPYAWGEGATWNTQPPLDGTRLATFATDLAQGVRQCVGLPVSARQPADTDLRIVAPTEGYLATDEHPDAAWRPTLTVSYDDGAPPTAWRPFTADGPWNRPIPPAPVIDPGSAAMVANLRNDPHPGIANLYDYGTKVYEADAATPRYRIDCLQPWGVCSMERELVPIPAGATANAGSDNAMTVIDRAAGKGYCFWQYRNDRATTSWGGVYDLNGPGDARPPECTGSGLPSMGGVVRLAEMRAGRIDHALVLATRYCQAPESVFRYPAGKSDGKYAGLGGIPEGARIQLDPAVNVDAIPGITAGEKTVARALQTHGAYVADCAAANMAFTFEHPNGTADPYPGVGFAWDYFALNRIPWDRLRVLRAWDGS